MAAHNIIIAADVDDTPDSGGRLRALRVAAESAEKKYIAAKKKSDEARRAAKEAEKKALEANEEFGTLRRRLRIDAKLPVGAEEDLLLIRARAQQVEDERADRRRRAQEDKPPTPKRRRPYLSLPAPSDEEEEEEEEGAFRRAVEVGVAVGVDDTGVAGADSSGAEPVVPPATGVQPPTVLALVQGDGLQRRQGGRSVGTNSSRTERGRAMTEEDVVLDLLDRINREAGEAGSLLIKPSDAAHRKALQVFQAAWSAEAAETADSAGAAEPVVEAGAQEAQEAREGSLRFYSCSASGTAGWAMHRFFAFVKMDTELRGQPAAVQYLDWDGGSRRGGARVRGKAWVVDEVGLAAMGGVERVMRSKPRVLTAIRGTAAVQEVVRTGLARGATTEQKLRAVFALGCTPMCALVDVGALACSACHALGSCGHTVCCATWGCGGREGCLGCICESHAEYGDGGEWGVGCRAGCACARRAPSAT